MKESRKDLTRAELMRLFGLLDEELASHGEEAVLYVVGGANIALAFDVTRTTTDVDAVATRGFDVVWEAARRVARSEPGLGADWLNSDFTGGTPTGGIAWSWMDNKDADEPMTVYEGRALTVHLASPEMMLALKTLACRDQDLDDIYLLMRVTGIRDADGLGRNLARFTGRRVFDEQQKPWMYLHIDPAFAYILDNAPADLRPLATVQRGGTRAVEHSPSGADGLGEYKVTPGDLTDGGDPPTPGHAHDAPSVSL